MNTTRCLLAVAVLATVTACREDPSDPLETAVGASGESEPVTIAPVLRKTIRLTPPLLPLHLPPPYPHPRLRRLLNRSR